MYCRSKYDDFEGRLGYMKGPAFTQWKILCVRKIARLVRTVCVEGHFSSCREEGRGKARGVRTAGSRAMRLGGDGVETWI